MKNLLSLIVQDIIKEIPAVEFGLQGRQKTFQEICNNYSVVMVVSRLPQMTPLFICEKGLKHIGMDISGISALGMKFFPKVLHHDNLSVVASSLIHFTTIPHEDFFHIYKINTTNQGWVWMYGCSRALSFCKDGSAEYIVTILSNIKNENIKDENDISRQFIHIHDLSLPEVKKFQSLSIREKEVLRLLAAGYNEEKISLMLNVSKHTVHSHKKTLYKKLEINSLAEAISFGHHIEQDRNK